MRDHSLKSYITSHSLSLSLSPPGLSLFPAMPVASVTMHKFFPMNNTSIRKRTEAPRYLCEPPDSPCRKYKSLSEIMGNTPISSGDPDYSNVLCERCKSGDGDGEMLLCDKCDRGFHIYCLRPIIVRVPSGPWFCPSCSKQKRVRKFPLLQTKIIDFFRIQRSSNSFEKSTSDVRKRRRRTTPLVLVKKKRRLLPFIPTHDPVRRLEQMASLASALSALKIEYSNELTYMPGMAPSSANQARFEKDKMQVLSREDTETLEFCSAMCKRGEWPPLVVVFDSREGFTVEADKFIKDLTIITEYTGDVDYLNNREHDDCDSMMTLLLAKRPSKNLVICPDKRGNIARFINGINNHTPEGRKKQNVKCVRYDVNGECRVLLVAIRDIAKGERLYYDYNGYEHEYPTEHFI